MEKDENVVAEALPEADIRHVAVIWGDGEDLPTVTYSGASPFEAIGLLRVAAQLLECKYALPFGDDDDEDDDDD